MEITVGPTGRVEDVRILRGEPGLDKPAEEAARQWIYSPTLVDGKPVSVILTAVTNAR